MCKLMKLSARKDVQDLIKKMDPASCGLQCQTAHVHEVHEVHEVLKLNEVYRELFPEKDYLHHKPLITG